MRLMRMYCLTVNVPMLIAVVVLVFWYPVVIMHLLVFVPVSRSVAMFVPVSLSVSVSVMLMTCARQEPGGCQIDGEPESGNRDGFAEMDGYGMNETVDGLIADQRGDHRQDDCRGETRQVAELTGAESKSTVARVPARIAIRERRQEQGAGMGGHVQSIGDQRERPEGDATHDLEGHGEPAEPDHGPGPALRPDMSLAEKGVAVPLLKEDGLWGRHEATSPQVAMDH